MKNILHCLFYFTENGLTTVEKIAISDIRYIVAVLVYSLIMFEYVIQDDM